MPALSSNLRIAVRGVYDLQRLRIQMGNRFVMNFKARLGQVAAVSEDELSEESVSLISQLRADYEKITDGVKILPRPSKFVGTELISNYTELALIHQYCTMEDNEESQFKLLEKILDENVIYKKYLSKVKGIGPALAGVLLSEIDFAKSKYPSSLWKYCGYDVAGDGHGRSKRAEHLVTYKYADKEGKEKERQGITFNPLLKTKLFLIGCSFLKCKSPFAASYYEYKARMEQHVRYGIANDGQKDSVSGHFITSRARRHMMAMRYMIKRFLVDLHMNAMTILGYPVSVEYGTAKLGLNHGVMPTPVAPVAAPVVEKATAKKARVRKPKAK